VFLFFGKEASVDRDKSDRYRATRENVIQKVGDGEARIISIRERAGSEGPCDIHLPHITNHAGEHDCRHQQQRCGKCCVLVRWPKQAQNARRETRGDHFGNIRRIRHPKPILHAYRDISRYEEGSLLQNREPHIPAILRDAR
jgi:hypothetical protein